jgi:hypothetical protein
MKDMHKMLKKLNLSGCRGADRIDECANMEFLDSGMAGDTRH